MCKQALELVAFNSEKTWYQVKNLSHIVWGSCIKIAYIERQTLWSWTLCGDWCMYVIFQTSPWIILKFRQMWWTCRAQRSANYSVTNTSTSGDHGIISSTGRCALLLEEPIFTPYIILVSKQWARICWFYLSEFIFAEKKIGPIILVVLTTQKYIKFRVM